MLPKHLRGIVLVGQERIEHSLPNRRLFYRQVTGPPVSDPRNAVFRSAPCFGPYVPWHCVILTGAPPKWPRLKRKAEESNPQELPFIWLATSGPTIETLPSKSAPGRIRTL
jgi:hypothetical protein